MSWIVRMIIVLPALAALGGLLARRQRALAAAVAIAVSAYVATLALIQWIAPSRTADIDTIGRLPLGDLSAPLHLLSDQASGLVSFVVALVVLGIQVFTCLLYTSPSPRDLSTSRMPSSA